MRGKKRIVGVIPARYDSKRLPGKPLSDICGKPMVVRVWMRASRSSVLDRVLVATDDSRIMAVCRRYSVPVVMTSRGLPSGSDRVFEALREESYDIAVNIQGDEPLLDPAAITQLVQSLPVSEERSAVASLAHPVTDVREFLDPDVVKVVIGKQGQALYFSRSPLPYSPEGVPERALRHIGLYAFTKEALAVFVALPQGKLEQQERLEQLRLLEAGLPIYISTVEVHQGGVNTDEDLERVRTVFRDSE